MGFDGVKCLGWSDNLFVFVTEYQRVHGIFYYTGACYRFCRFGINMYERNMVSDLFLCKGAEKELIFNWFVLTNKWYSI